MKFSISNSLTLTKNPTLNNIRSLSRKIKLGKTINKLKKFNSWNLSKPKTDYVFTFSFLTTFSISKIKKKINFLNKIYLIRFYFGLRA